MYNNQPPTIMPVHNPSSSTSVSRAVIRTRRKKWELSTCSAGAFKFETLLLSLVASKIREFDCHAGYVLIEATCDYL